MKRATTSLLKPSLSSVTPTTSSSRGIISARLPSRPHGRGVSSPRSPVSSSSPLSSSSSAAASIGTRPFTTSIEAGPPFDPIMAMPPAPYLMDTYNSNTHQLFSSASQTAKFVLTTSSTADQTSLVYDLLSRLRCIIGDEVPSGAMPSLLHSRDHVFRTPLRILPARISSSSSSRGGRGMIAFQVFNANAAQCEAIAGALRDLQGVRECEVEMGREEW